MRMRSKKCPRCGKIYTEYPALSRRDNRTNICSACGVEEAMIDARINPMDERERKFLVLVKRRKLRSVS